MEGHSHDHSTYQHFQLAFLPTRQRGAALAVSGGLRAGAALATRRLHSHRPTGGGVGAADMGLKNKGCAHLILVLLAH